MDTEEARRPVQHDVLWFDDGNIVLVASGTTAFKVHRSILARRSTVFRDMFSLPQPVKIEGGEAFFDGCPVVHVSDDPRDFAIMLDIFYEGFTYIRTVPAWPTVRAMLMLGTKYQADELRKEGIFQLERVYPEDIIEYCTIESGTACMEYWDSDSISIANTVRSLGLDERLHIRALYECCQLTVTQLIRGVESTTGRHENLHENDLIACLNGKIVLAQESERRGLTLFRSGRSSACSSEACKHQMREMRAGYSEAYIPSDPLRAQDASEDESWFELCCQQLCADCASFYQTEDRKERQELMDHLDRYIRLDPMSPHPNPVE